MWPVDSKLGQMLEKQLQSCMMTHSYNPALQTPEPESHIVPHACDPAIRSLRQRAKSSPVSKTNTSKKAIAGEEYVCVLWLRAPAPGDSSATCLWKHKEV